MKKWENVVIEEIELSETADKNSKHKGWCNVKKQNGLSCNCGGIDNSGDNSAEIK